MHSARMWLWAAWNLVAAFAGAAAGGATWHTVAADTAGSATNRAHLIGGSFYTFHDDEIPESVLKKNDPLRTVAFGERVRFGYRGLDPKAACRVRLTFVTERPRVMRITAGGEAIADRLAVEPGAARVEEAAVPAGAYSGGDLVIELARVEGPNAAVSAVEILSTRPGALTRFDPPAAALSPRERAAVEAALPNLLPRLSSRPDRIDGVRLPRISLNGEWSFCPEPAQGFERQGTPAGEWKPIRVPGEWIMQGFSVNPGQAAGYRRGFHLPGDWGGRRVRLRFDAVYSRAQVWVNGRWAGGHEGGFTPFELDVTHLVRAGGNTLAVAVNNESFADILASGNQYAAHPMGGLLRKVTLFALPDVNLADLKIVTEFGRHLRDATLKLRLRVVNDGEAEAKEVTGEVSLRRWNGAGDVSEPVQPPVRFSLPALAPGAVVPHELALAVASPRPWDSEHPNLYVAEVRLLRGGRPLAVWRERFGFRQVETRGNRLFINGRPVKLRGVCRHETHPLLGRSLTAEEWTRDARLFKEANCNFIRTSHYPPAEEFLALCDEIGLFVELEAPLCWVGHGANQQLKPWQAAGDSVVPYLLQANLETVQAHANAPSVILRSMANESHWYDAWNRLFDFMRVLDPTRPVTFHDQSWGDYNSGGSSVLPVANFHYPGLDGPAKADAMNRPLTFGEFCHLNCYNRRELAADPAVREAFGRALKEMWDRMYRSTGNLGGSIWSGVDDLFLLPDGRIVGYGEWGPIDGWRRPKPEYWHVRKCFSPVRIEGRRIAAPAAGQPLKVAVENRHNFTDLAEVKIEWAVGDEKGVLNASLPPRTAGELAVPVKRADVEGRVLSLTFTSPQGFVLDEYRLGIGPEKEAAPVAPPRAAGAATELGDDADSFAVRAGGFEWVVGKSSGQIRAGGTRGTPVVTGGPHLMLLPLNNEGGTQLHGTHMYVAPLNGVCANWTAESVSAHATNGAVEIRVRGRCDEASGGYTLRFSGDGVLEVDYAFAVSRDVNPRQWGMVFDLPRACDTLTWERDAFWTVYPEDHIGRPAGTATGRLHGRTYVNGRNAPDWPWSLDENDLGSNDFRATRERIRWATLTDRTGRGLRVSSGGRQAFRAWLEGGGVRALVAGFSTGGADGFLSRHYDAERRPLKKGARIEDRVALEILPR